GDFGDVAHLLGEVRRHGVDAVGEVLPGAGHPRDLRLPSQLPFRPYLARDPCHLRGKGVELIHHDVDRLLELEDLSSHLHRDLAGAVPTRLGYGDVGDVAHLTGQVARHGVDALGEVLPGPGHPRHDRLAAELALSADFAGDAGDLGGEGAELIDHRIDGVLDEEDLTADVDGDLLAEVAASDRGRDLGAPPYLHRQVGRHGVDAVGEVLPGAGDARDLRLAAELPFRPHLARHAGDLRGEGVELVHHDVDRL